MEASKGDVPGGLFAAYASKSASTLASTATFSAYAPQEPGLEPVQETSSSAWLSLSSYKPPSSPSTTIEPAPSDKNKRKSKKEHIDSHRRDRKKKKKRSRSRSRSREKAAISKERPTVTAPSEYFKIERRGDPYNLDSSSTYWKELPKYDHRKTIKLIHKGDQRARSDVMRYFNVPLEKEDGALAFSAPRSQADLSDFLPLFASEAMHLLSKESNPLGIYDTSTTFYAQGIALPETSQPDSEFMRKDMMLVKTEKLNQHLRSNPYDVDKWLEYIDLALEEDIKSLDKIKGRDKREGKSLDVALSEKRLMIVEKALNENPNSVQLKIKRLEILKNLWEDDKVAEEWRKLAFVYPSDVNVWHSYFQFMRQSIGFFSFIKTCRVFKKCLETLIRISEKSVESHKPTETLDCDILKIIYEYVTFLRSCGYVEKAFATLQALMEFNFFTPDQLTSQEVNSLTNWIDFFEPFWDSNAPRIGEDEAQGWGQVMELRRAFEPLEDLSLDEAENQNIQSASSKEEAWIRLETLKEEKLWLPLRGEPQEDPERSVLFDDISFVLYRTRQKMLLAQIFFKFLGADTFEDSLLEKGHYRLETDDAISFVKDFNYENRKKVAENSFFKLIQDGKGLSTEDKSKLITAWIRYRQKDKKPNCDKSFIKSERKFIKEFLKQNEFRNALGLWEQYAAFEWIIASNPEESRRVFQTSLSLLKNFVHKQQLMQYLATYLDLELEIQDVASGDESNMGLFHRQCRDQNAYERLKSAIMKMFCIAFLENHTPGSSISPSHLLKVRQAIDSSTDCDCSSPTYPFHVFCHAIFTYLTSGSMSSANEIFDNAIEAATLNSKSGIIKHIWNLYVKFHVFIIRKVISPISHLRKVLNRALTSFPYDETLVKTLMQLDMHCHASGRMRRFFDQHVSKIEPPISSVLLSLQYEFKLLAKVTQPPSGRVNPLVPWAVMESEDVATANGTCWRIRSLFEKYLASKQLASCPLLWRAYCQFEVAQKEFERARNNLYRGLQVCPWSKLLIMDGIKFLTHKDYEELVDLMMEKGLRLRTTPDEIELLWNSLRPTESSS